MTYPEPIRRKYHAVCALARGGVGGEQQNALRFKRDLETKSPGIQFAPRPPHRKPDPVPDPPKPNGNFGQHPTAEAPPEDEESDANRWSRWSQMAGEAFSWATRVAGEAASVEYGRRCAEHFVEVATRSLPSGKWQVTSKIEMDNLYACAEGLTYAQKVAFANYVGGRVAEAIMTALGPEPD